MADNDYDAFARAYAADNETSAYNAYYERPASLRMLGDVAGQSVLDAGCGAGAHNLELIRAGATVAGMDLSAGLLRIARGRLGPDVLLLRRISLGGYPSAVPASTRCWPRWSCTTCRIGSPPWPNSAGCCGRVADW